MEESLLRILIVEGSRDHAENIETMLSSVWEDGLTRDRRKLDIQRVDSLVSAFTLLDEIYFDLILLDLFLPDGEGLGVFTMVHDRVPHVAIVILTAINDRRMALGAVRLGAQDYLVKSHLDVESLRHSLSHALERHALVRELEEQRQELAASENRLRTIIATNTTGLMVCDREGVIRFANEAAATLIGTKVAQLQGAYLGHLAQTDFTVEISILSGPFRRAMVSMRAVPIDWEGADAFLVSMQDVTERERSETALQRAYREKEQLLSAIASILIGVSPDGSITTWNAVAQDVFAQDADQVIGKTLSECEIDWDVQMVLDGMRHCQIMHTPVRVDDVPFRRRNGRQGFLGMTINPIEDAQSDCSGVLLVGRDITEPKRIRAELEQARQRELRMKDQFLSHVSHELRTPLYAIYQFVSILQDGLAGELNSEQEEYLGIISRNTNQLRTMIRDLLDLTRAQTGKLTIESQEMDLCDLVDEVAYTMRLRAVSEGLQLSCVMSPGLPPVLADPARVREVLNNLIDNAIKFTPVEGVIDIRVDKDPKTPGYLRISVSDTGVGIDPAEKEAIFSYLYQGAEATTLSRKGMGIGLYLCKELITRQGGSIWVESVQGQGSAFFFTLPVVA